MFFSLIYKTTISSKLRAFLYYFLHRCLKTNSFLWKLGIVESDLCVFCGNEKETFFIYFGNVTLLKDFSENWKLGCQSLQVLPTLLAKKSCWGQKYNLWSILIWFLLWQNSSFGGVKSVKKHPSFTGYLCLLSQYLETEYYIAEKNLKLDKHRKKWDSIPLGNITVSTVADLQ